MRHPRLETAAASLPLADEAVWLAANQEIGRLCALPDPQVRRARRAAEEMAGLLAQADALLEPLCAATCPWCPRPCCLDARVWLDRRDLLFIHLGGQAPPPAQLRQSVDQPCRYLGRRGCALPRALRPWVCTWYLCPTLTARLAGQPAELAQWRLLEARIKALRRQIGLLRG